MLVPPPQVLLRTSYVESRASAVVAVPYCQDGDSATRTFGISKPVITSAADEWGLEWTWHWRGSWMRVR